MHLGVTGLGQANAPTWQGLYLTSCVTRAEADNMLSGRNGAKEGCSASRCTHFSSLVATSAGPGISAEQVQPIPKCTMLRGSDGNAS